MIPYKGGKVYGPYNRKEDNRQHVIILFPDRTRLTVSYPKYLYELNSGKYLEEGFEIHHRNGDETDNTIENLTAVLKFVHRVAHGKGNETWICAYCGKPFIATSLQASRRKSGQKRGKCKTGPFCSPQCKGKINN